MDSKFPLTIENQEQLDELMKSRLERARASWEKEAGIEEYRKQAEEAEARAEARVQEAEAKAYGRVLERDARTVLGSMNVTDPKRQELVLKLAGTLEETPQLENGDPDPKALERRFKELYKSAPDVFGADAQVLERGLDTSTRDSSSSSSSAWDSLTEERVAIMSPDEINSNWDRIKAWMAGERS